MLDVHFNAKQLGYSLSSTPFFHYVYDNGPDSLFSGYAWSLDVMVDYAWVQLDALNKVLVVLLIVEVSSAHGMLHCSSAGRCVNLVHVRSSWWVRMRDSGPCIGARTPALPLQALLVQITTMSYEFLLLRAANCEAMKRFSVFLALPSATVRSMASRQLQVRAHHGHLAACVHARCQQQHTAILDGCTRPSCVLPQLLLACCQVDDDDKSDLEDDELEALNAAGAAETEQQAATSKAGDAKQSKSVRMSVVGGGGECLGAFRVLSLHAPAIAPSHLSCCWCR